MMNKQEKYINHIVNDLIKKTKFNVRSNITDPMVAIGFSFPKELGVLGRYSGTLNNNLVILNHYISLLRDGVSVTSIKNSLEKYYAVYEQKIRIKIVTVYKNRIMEKGYKMGDDFKSGKSPLTESTEDSSHKYINYVVNDLVKKTKFNVSPDIYDPMVAVGFTFPDELGIKRFSGTLNNNIVILNRPHIDLYRTGDVVIALEKHYAATSTKIRGKILSLYTKIILKKAYNMVDDLVTGKVPLTESTSKKDKFIDIVVTNMIKKTNFDENGKVIDYPFPHMKSQAMGIIYITSSVYEWISETYGVRGGLDPYYNIILPIYRKYEEEIKNLRSTD